MNRMTKSGKRELDILAEDYQEALDKPSTYDVQIDLDVPRTISGHVLFRTRYGQGYVVFPERDTRLLNQILVSGRCSMFSTPFHSGVRTVDIAKGWAQ